MANGDIGFFEQGAFGAIGTRRFLSKGTATAINPGEPVYVTTAVAPFYVEAMSTNNPSIALNTAYLVGIAQSLSTHTSTAAGVVDVFPAVPGVVYEISPNVAATYGLTRGSENQVTYNSLVGTRVLIDLTAGSYTLLSTEGINNGCVVEYRDATKAKGKVAFSFRQGCTYWQKMV